MDYIIPNESELEVLTDSQIRNIKDAEEQSRKLLNKGVLLVTPEKTKHFEAFSIKTVDTTGAGDAFCGSLAFALSCGKTLEDSIIIANAAAGFSVTKVGTAPAMPYRKELEKFLQNNNLNKL